MSEEYNSEALLKTIKRRPIVCALYCVVMGFLTEFYVAWLFREKGGDSDNYTTLQFVECIGFILGTIVIGYFFDRFMKRFFLKEGGSFVRFVLGIFGFCVWIILDIFVFNGVVYHVY